LNILIAAGGTGGHIFPAIALGEALRRHHPAVTFQYLCGERPLERELYAMAGITPLVFPARQMGGGIWGRLQGAWAAVTNTWRACRLIRRDKYDAVIGMGGYVAGPAVLGGILARRITAVHEANSIPGKTNRLLAPWVDLCAVHFDAALARMKTKSGLRVGMPIRESATGGRRAEAMEFFGLDPARRTLLVIGGSQGARFLYESLMEALPILDRPEHADVQILWSTGAANYEMLENRLRADGPEYVSVHLERFINRMDLALAAADVAVARAGASTVAELVACGVRALYIPFPHAIYDHQTLNAREVAACGAGDVVAEKDLTPARFAAAVTGLLASAGSDKRFVAPVSLDSGEAAKRLAAALVKLAGG
jgi:UDP-N-acetylglucosamine--N-acetylmuramyl-(pentapeptide) pyrophosphoryl-undecaprenol N-acetylglucosamine transferase